MKKLVQLTFLLSLLAFLIMPFTAGAQTASGTIPSIKDRLSAVGGASGYVTDPTLASTPRIVGIVVGAFINFTGLTFIVLMIIAGYGWMTSNGSEEKIKKSINTIKASIIGLVVSLSAWVIWNFIFERLIVG